jgi:hypothetical protein
MRQDTADLQLKQTGKGFILINIEGLTGRMLTKTYVDQLERTYVKVNGELTPLTTEHSFLSAD